jgi:acetyl-CoA carboxylase biotin carboxyl carrier protein
MDVKQIIRIIDKFSEANIRELEISEGNLHLRLSKNGSSEPSASQSLAVPASTLSEPAEAVPESVEGDYITSPIVATYYASPSPDSPAFVSVGSRVKKGDTLCILEAMKMMNHLEAEFDCEILAVHCKGGDFVEYGQKLFTVKKV